MTAPSLDDQLIKENKIRPNLQRAKIAQILIWAVMAVDIVSIISSYMQYNLLEDLRVFNFVSDQEIDSNIIREQMVGILYLIVFIISAITFIQWFRRAYFNLNQRINCSYSEGWAAGSWFVPILCLFRPFQIMKEMSQKTSKLVQSESDDTSIIGWWWAFWIISSFIGNYTARIAFQAETIDNFINSTIADIVLSILGIPLAIISVKMIKSYSIKEEKLLEIELNEN